mmetsp:Transcript_20777/g.33468  ORF Transcript_20777/g.33468 Transcript_20777/m.33468 type:complete len:111 (+) Transcript_20777:78-410(+)
MTVAAPTDSNNDKGSCAVVKSINAPDEMRPNVPELKGGVEGAVKIELPELPDKKDLSMTSACCCCLCVRRYIISPSPFPYTLSSPKFQVKVSNILSRCYFLGIEFIHIVA